MSNIEADHLNAFHAAVLLVLAILLFFNRSRT